MTDRGRFALAVVVLVSTGAGVVPADAEIYRWVDARGNVTYTDRAAPPPEAALAAEAPSAIGQAPSTSSAAGPARVDDALELSGLRRQLRGLPDMVIEQFLAPNTTLAPADRATVRHLVGRHFAPESVYPLLRADLVRRVDREKLQAVVAWLRSPVGRRITAEEIAGAAPKGQAAAAAWIARLGAEPPSAPRVELVERLQWIGGAGDTSVEILLTVARSFSLAMQAALPPERRLKPGHVEGQLGAARARLLPVVRQAAFAQMLFTYRGLSDGELREYAALMASDGGRWLSAAMHRATLTAVRAAADRAAAEVVRAVPPNRWRTASPSTAAR